jgi:hypothetical protein
VNVLARKAASQFWTNALESVHTRRVPQLPRGLPFEFRNPRDVFYGSMLADQNTKRWCIQDDARTRLPSRQQARPSHYTTRDVANRSTFFCAPLGRSRRSRRGLAVTAHAFTCYDAKKGWIVELV